MLHYHPNDDIVVILMKGIVEKIKVGDRRRFLNGGSATIFVACSGPEYIDWVFNAAQAADPDAKLFINEYILQNELANVNACSLC